ncbi:hypothetical protein ACFFRR_011752 [Megaselia abdita]
MALNYLYMFEFVVDDLLITTMNECAPEEYPTYVEMSFRSQCYVSICDQEEGGCMEATCRNGKCALFALDEELAENDTLFVHVYKRRPGKKCKFLLGLAAVPVYAMFKKVTRHFHEENPSLVMYLGISLDDEENENTQKSGDGNTTEKKNGDGNTDKKRQSTASNKDNKRQSNAGGKGEKQKSQKDGGQKKKERKKGGQDEEKKEEGGEQQAEETKPEEKQEKPAEKRESTKPKKKERKPCPVREEPPPPDSKYKTVCQQAAEAAQSSKDAEREAWETECRDRYEPDRDRTEEEQRKNESNNQNGGNGDGNGECPKEPNFVAGCMTEINPRQEEYCPTAEISKKLLSLTHCNGKQTGNIVLIIRLSCMGPCIVSPFIFGKNSLCQPPLCAPDCEPPATQPCDKKKGKTDYPGPPNPASNTFTANYHNDRAAGGGGGGRIAGGGPHSCCPSQPKKCCKPKVTVEPVHRYFNCDPCAGCPFAERPCDTPNCPNNRQSSNPCDGDKDKAFDPCACFDKKKQALKEKASKGKKGKREKGGMDSGLENTEKLQECVCDECREMDQMRLAGGCDVSGRLTGGCDDCDEIRRLTGGCGACNERSGRKKCKCEEPQPVPAPPYFPPTPICPPMAESQVVRKATAEEGDYDEFEANLNGTGITIRVLKNSHTVTDVLDSENEDSGCEMSNEICGKKKSKNSCPEDIYNNPSSKKLLQTRTGGKIENGCNLPLVKGTIKYSENERCLGDRFEIPSSSIRPCEGRVNKVSKYRKTPLELKNCCLQVAGENIDNTMNCAHARAPKGGIEVCHKKCVDEDSDVFVLRLGKKQHSQNKKKLVELELKTPKEPFACPIQHTTVFTHVNEKILDAEMGKKGGKKKGKKGKKK